MAGFENEAATSIRKIRNSITDALGRKDGGKKLDGLLALRGEVVTEFSRLGQLGQARRRGMKALMIAGGIMFSFTVALAGHIAIPVVALVAACGGGAFLTGLFSHTFSEERRAKAKEDEEVLVMKINREILNTAKARPQSATKSEKFQRALAGGFNTAAMIDAMYASQGRRFDFSEVPRAAL